MSTQTQWFFTRNGGNKVGPVTSRELKRLVATGQLARTDRIQKAGMEKMVAASRLKGLFAAAADDVET
jgi:hypothetical protein